MENYANDLLIFGIDSRKDKGLRNLPSKYLSILLVKRNNEPFKERWSLPGKLINELETSKEASIKILEKDFGLKKVYIQQIGVNDEINRDPRGRIISVSYMALVDRTKIKDNLKDNVKWFDISIKEENKIISIILKNEKDVIQLSVRRETIDKKSKEYEYSLIDNVLAFDHDKILVKGIMELRNKVENTDIVFNLMPELFTIGELKQVYEILLGKQLVNSAFRRTIAEKIIVTDQQISTGGHRPSYLYKYNESDN